MRTPRLIHQQVHQVSHYQVGLFDAEHRRAYPEHGHGDALVIFAKRGVRVSTAWDDNGKAPPEVEIEVWRCRGEPGELEELDAIAEAEITIGQAGALVGNAITGDLAEVDLPPGQFRVLVATDIPEPFAARKVAFYLWRPAGPSPLAAAGRTL